MNILDKAITAVAPVWGAKRQIARMQASSLSRYSGQYAKRTMVGWSPRIDDPNANGYVDLPDIRGKSRELTATSSIAKGAIETKVSNIVGSGLQVESRLDSKLLGITEDEAREKQDIIEKRFRLWASGHEADMLQQRNFYALQEQAFRAMLIDGDMLSLLYIIKNDKNRPNQVNPLAIQNVGAHQLCNKNNSMNTEKMINGVEIDKHGAPIAYHIVSPNGQTNYMDGAMHGDWRRVSRYGAKSGRLNVVHLMNSDSRIGQYRGIPCLAPVVDLIYDLTKYEKSELTATVLASYFTVFVKSKSGDLEDSPFEQMKTNSNSPASLLINGTPAQEKTEADEYQYQLGAGMINALAEDEDIVTASPTRPNTAYEAFVQAMMTEIGMGIGVPYEVLMHRYQSSYSASRASFLDAWKMFTSARRWLSSQWCQPIFEAWLELEVVSGRIDLKGFMSDPVMKKAWCSATWHGDARGMLDPKKEIEASVLAIDNYLSTMERESRLITGEDWDNTIERRAFEDRRMEELGIGGKEVEEPTMGNE